ncbi:MAG: SRPBCC family protein [Acidimicrobiia bacterium]|nr:SRPBCC family protein [Acidimicrobiia bacterium]
MGNFVEGARVTTADAAAVWALLVDVDRWPETFTPHLAAAQLDGGVEVGARGWVKTKLPLPRSTFTVTTVEDGRSWAWRGKMLWMTMDFDHRLETMDSRTRIEFDVDLSGPLAGIVRPLARLTYGPQMERALDLLVQHAERAT